MKVALFEIEPREEPVFDALKPAHEVAHVQQALDRETALAHADAEVVSTFIFSRLDRQVLEQMPALRLIATRSTGFDHIDLDYCASHRIAVANVPSYGENTVAEHVFALLLAISHRLPEAMERAQHGHFSPEGLQGFDLAGRTLGVIGTGRIGQHVIRIARGFQMRVLAHDATPQSRLAAELGFHYTDLAGLYGEADVISLNVPSLPETRHMLSATAFEQMKDGVVVINTARGDLIDTRALIQALTSGKVAAAGLDVLPDEPLIREEAELICSIFCEQHDLRDLVANHVLLRMKNVIVTPHSAFNTREAVQRIAETTVENIRAFAEGRPQNLVAAPVAATSSSKE
ncbi:hydroxyacid dehydrogenase [Tranquillimonas alkanivorans]|uniref:D-lactate dehydrogenase n=1 Tax=Tranquillimonas alkanivorans TaxID=441119 RepID=A0A1I5WUA4_9RHOB|nr:hydroxyacid dehydrogenase [Tranquillimonas alkanivorans]SFQ23270.1 D-lactate dehydrogenase [Tranquillimonas alkanivorans]